MSSPITVAFAVSLGLVHSLSVGGGRLAVSAAVAAPRCRTFLQENPPPDLSDEELLRIVLQEMPDEEVNTLVWKYLGYRYDDERSCWDASEVFPKWRAKYPQPPDLIGVTRTYTREVDEPVLRAVQALQKSVPTEHKDNLRQTLRPLGWSGFKLEGLTPNKTRRAQVNLSEETGCAATHRPAR